LNEKLVRRVVGLFGFSLAGVLATFHALQWWHSGALWRDEVNSVNAARALLADGLFNSLTNDSFPVMWPVLLRLWLEVVRFEHDFAIRFLGLAVGLGLLASLFATSRWTRSGVPIASTILVGMNSVIFLHGDAVRGYGVGLLALVLLYGRVVRTVETPTRRNGGWLVVSALAATQLAFANAPAFGSIGGAAILVCLARRKWRALGMLSAASAIAALSLLPYVPIFEAHGRWFDLVRRPQTFGQILSVARAGFAPSGIPSLVAWSVLSALAASGLCIAARKRGWRGLTDAQAIAMAAAPLTMVVFAVYFKTWSSPLNPWYFVSPIAVLAMTIETGLASLDDLGSVTRLLRAAVLFVAAVFASVTLWPVVGNRMTNVDLIARTLEARASERDLVLVMTWQAEVTFDRYYRGRSPWVTVPDFGPADAAAAGWPPGNLHRFQPYLLYKARVAQSDPIRALLGRVRSTLESGGRIWIIGPIRFLNPGETPMQLPPAPSPQWGWYAAAYEWVWSQQVAYEIQTHARDIQAVPEVLDVACSAYELLPLYRADGSNTAN